MCVCVGQVDNSQTVHLRVLQTIYKRLLGSRLDCPRYGPHWENIGFQGNRPNHTFWAHMCLHVCVCARLPLDVLTLVALVQVLIQPQTSVGRASWG